MFFAILPSGTESFAKTMMKSRLLFALLVCMPVTFFAQAPGFDGICCDPDSQAEYPGFSTCLQSGGSYANDGIVSDCDCSDYNADPLACIPIDQGTALLIIAGLALAWHTFRRSHQGEWVPVPSRARE